MMSAPPSTDETSDFDEILKEITALGVPKKDDQGRLEFSYYKTVFNAIMQKSKLVFADEKKEFLNKRRQLLKD
jgi:hypothetical protein